MARVTVEDCLQHVENRFDLVLKAAKRAHALELGEVQSQVSLDNDKPTVLALREIALGLDISTPIASAETAEELFAQDLTALDNMIGNEAVPAAEEAKANSTDELILDDALEQALEEAVAFEDIEATTEEEVKLPSEKPSDQSSKGDD